MTDCPCGQGPVARFTYAKTLKGVAIDMVGLRCDCGGEFFSEAEMAENKASLASAQLEEMPDQR